MSIPRPSELHPAILEEIRKHGGKIKLSDLYDPLTKGFPQLTSADLQRRTPSGSNYWQGYIRFALDALKKRGDVVNLAHGVWGLNNPPPPAPPKPYAIASGDRNEGNQLIEIVLSGGGKANITVPRNITNADVERIRRVLSSLVEE